MPKYPGFIGGSGTGQSVSMESARTVNWFPEIVETGTGKNAAVFLPTPGLACVWDTLNATGKVRALSYKGGRLLAIVDATLYELSLDYTLATDGLSVTAKGTVTSRGTVTDDGKPAYIEYNGTHYFIVSGGDGYTLVSNTLSVVAGDYFQLGFSDGYFISLDGRTVKISNLNDGTTWDALDYATKEDDPGDIAALLVDHGEVWLWGDRRTLVYWDSGNADFPFERISGARIEEGIGAGESAQRVDNTAFWIGASERGAGVVWKANGYTPQRISSHTVERALQDLGSSISAVTSYAYMQAGHTFYAINLPTTTWVYDCATGLWCERQYLTPVTEVATRHKANCHTVVNGLHLVGGVDDGKIYMMKEAIGSDEGEEIQRIRRAPHLYAENKRLFMHNIELGLEPGLGLSSGQGSNPLVMMTYSWDGGKTWSSEISQSAGKIGKYSTRVDFNRLGSGYDFVVQISVTDPVPWRIVDCFYTASLGA